MKRIAANDPITKSPDLSAENLAKLRALFPELITEGKDGVAVNVDVLKSLVGDKTVTDTEEKYGLNWHGKRLARQLALTPSTGTLRPCPDESVDWDNTKNLMIEGDNLEVLKLLQKSYSGKVKLIYIDPPYNTGKDFVYPDNFQDNIKNYLELTGQVEGGRKISSNTEASGRFHTDWLNMMYPRLKLARNLLREDGVIFISIDDREMKNINSVCDEVFGEENFVGTITRKTKLTSNKGTHFAPSHEYILVFCKNICDLPMFNDEEAQQDEDYLKLFRFNDERGKFNEVSLYMPSLDPMRGCANQRYFISCPDGSLVLPPGASFPKEKANGSGIRPTSTQDKVWRWTFETFQKNLKENRIVFKNTNTSPLIDPDGNQSKWNIYTKIYLHERQESGMLPNTFFDKYPNSAASKLLIKLEIPFDFSKPYELLLWFLKISNVANKDIVLDFFAGSGTTGHAVMTQNATDGGNRRYILVQLPEPLDPSDKDQKTAADFCDSLKKPRTIAELTKERLRRAGKKIREEWQAKQTPSESPKSKKSAVKGPDLFSDPDLAVAAQTPAPTTPPDLGFRVFKLDSTNIMEWDPKHADLKEAMQMSIEHLKDDRSNDDILYELLLKLGIDLCTPIETKTITKHQVHSIGVGSMLVCLSPSITQDDLETLAMGIIEWWNQLAPTDEEKKDRKTSVVFRDSAFKDDIIKTNLSAILHQNGLTTIRSL